MSIKNNAILLMKQIQDSKEKVLNSVLLNYEKEDDSFIEAFEKIVENLELDEMDLRDREALDVKQAEKFSSTVCDAHLIERGFVEGHTNYEYEWYLHMDHKKNKKEYLELFINRVFIREVSVAVVIKDYIEKENEETLSSLDAVELIEELDNEHYREILTKVLADSNERIESIMNKTASEETGALSPNYISHIYGGVSEKELIQYAEKISLATDDYVVIALDQKIDQLVEIVAGKGSDNEMDTVMGLGYLLDFYGIDFEFSQTS